MQTLNFDLQQINLIDNGLWTIGNVFDSVDFNYIVSSVLSIPLEQYTTGINGRYEMTWQNDGILEDLTTAFGQVLPKIKTLTNLDLTFSQVRIWRDKTGFMIPFHEDDQQAMVHIQTYLYGSKVGTTWYTESGRTTVPFCPNSGYITECSKRYPHGMLSPTTSDRYSLYATFNQNSIALSN
jgi:hypothetical protein